MTQRAETRDAPPTCIWNPTSFQLSGVWAWVHRCVEGQWYKLEADAISSRLSEFRLWRSSEMTNRSSLNTFL